ncbi:MAG: PilZ domain-containing protein [Deltaproteobacteria bacterium]|nr:PilZ domain-containing protein [Deltaproteobacteria bacterium]
MPDEYGSKRKFPRIPSQNALLVKKLAADRVEGFAKTRVVGLGGCMFVSDEHLGVGTPLEILISVRGTVAKAVGRVVYEVPQGPREVHVGVEFLELPAPDREVIESLFPPVGADEASV